MDSKTVNRAIKDIIRPFLKARGFSHFTPRNGWRFSGNQTDVINVQSFNSCLAENIGCTTHSFSVNLGCTHSAFPLFRQGKIKTAKSGHLLFEEFRCPFRLTLKRTIPQHLSGGLFKRKFRRRDIWYIGPKGEYLEEAMTDAHKQIETLALPWFENLQSDERMLDILLHSDEEMDSLWGFGRNPSPMRSYLTGYMAHHLGKNDLARTHLNAVLDSQSFADEKNAIREDLKKLNS